MHYSYLQKKGKKRLLAIFADWGVDYRHFPRLKSSTCDILLIWNYRDLGVAAGDDEPAFPYLETRSLKYSRVDVLAWGHGAAAAQWAMDDIDQRLGSCIAVNGVFAPLQGSSREYREALANINEETPERVYAMMMSAEGSESEAPAYVSNISVEEWREEISALLSVAALACSRSEWRLSIISLRSSLYPAQALAAMWQGVETRLEDWPYFPPFQAVIDRYIDC